MPPRAIRRLPQSSSYRKHLIQLRTGEVQRVEITVEGAMVKIGSVASTTLTEVGRAMFEVLIGASSAP